MNARPWSALTRGARAAAALALASAGLVRPALAQVDLGRVQHAFEARAGASLLRPESVLPAALATGRGGRIPVIVRGPPAELAAEPGLLAFGEFATGQALPAELSALVRAHPSWSFDWAPPRHLLLDKADGWVHASSVRQATGAWGAGVVVGIVDSGVELSHPDLRTADGKTRVAWLIDFSQSPAGKQRSLESQYKCGASTNCAIYYRDDLNALLSNDIADDEPVDSAGHGTHVASLAAGNGLGSQPPKYIGIAPEATLVIARVTATSDGTIFDADLLTGVKFVFERAAELGMPAVVNLSLGSDFGAHDGSSGLEQGLAALVGPDFPGRALVVAAGNSATLFSDLTPAYPGPFGIHTEVHVPVGTSSRVPVIIPAPSAQTPGAVYIWIGFRHGDAVAVGLEDAAGPWIPPVGIGGATTLSRAGITATIVNGTVNSNGLTGVGRDAAVLIMSGIWTGRATLTLTLEGHGTASLWAQSTGGLNAEAGTGAVFPRGEKQGTINIPASHPGLIAVGATINRTSWVDVTGTLQSFPSLGSLENAPLDSTAYFSAAGPNALGTMKPDIVAPGVYVAGAMAQIADPRINGGVGLFAAGTRCRTSSCFVVDEKHAVTTGTSMAAPIVSGAVALLLQKDPTLTQVGVRALLQAGARPLTGLVLDEQQIGVGALDVAGSLDAQADENSPVTRLPGAASWLALGASFVHPDPDWPLVGYAELRDDDGKIADGFDPRRLRFVASPALIVEPFTRVAAGLYQFSVAAPSGSGGGTLQLAVLFDEKPLLERRVPIGVDRWVAEGGVSARGGCAFAPGFAGTRAQEVLSAAGLIGLAAAVARARRRRARAGGGARA